MGGFGLNRVWVGSPIGYLHSIFKINFILLSIYILSFLILFILLLYFMCYGHVISKICQCANIYEKTCWSLSYVSIKGVQGNIFYFFFKWLKILRKWWETWEVAFMAHGIFHWKLNTLVITIIHLNLPYKKLLFIF